MIRKTVRKIFQIVEIEACPVTPFLWFLDPGSWIATVLGEVPVGVIISLGSKDLSTE
jgi:hypothetical protein